MPTNPWFLMNAIIHFSMRASRRASGPAVLRSELSSFCVGHGVKGY